MQGRARGRKGERKTYWRSDSLYCSHGFCGCLGMAPGELPCAILSVQFTYLAGWNSETCKKLLLFIYLDHKITSPWTPKPWKMQVFIPKIWVIPSKNEGFWVPMELMIGFLLTSFHTNFHRRQSSNRQVWSCWSCCIRAAVLVQETYNLCFHDN